MAFTVVFQPIVALEDLRVLGYEALARFPGDLQASPDRWFAAAEQLGLRYDLELAAVKKALNCFEDLPPDTYLSINASPRTIASPVLARMLSKVEPARIVVEISESEAIGDFPRFAEAIDELRELGVRLALDDTGSGEVSLQSLLAVHPDVVKIDTELTRSIDTSPERQAVTLALAVLAARSGATSLAEGVETEEELSTVRSLGVEAAQGFLLGRPDRLSALLGRRARIEKESRAAPSNETGVQSGHVS
ncbi:MAG: EAL domain-containing protein [Acidimicrobiales bacterium]